jgi:hypothetical protein
MKAGQNSQPELLNPLKQCTMKTVNKNGIWASVKIDGENVPLSPPVSQNESMLRSGISPTKAEHTRRSSDVSSIPTGALITHGQSMF